MIQFQFSEYFLALFNFIPLTQPADAKNINSSKSDSTNSKKIAIKYKDTYKVRTTYYLQNQEVSLSHKQLKSGRASLNAYFILTFVPGDLFLAIAKNRVLGCTRKGKYLVLCSTNAGADAKSGWAEGGSMKGDFLNIKAYVR